MIHGWVGLGSVSPVAKQAVKVESDLAASTGLGREALGVHM